jgi:hypothetical protein
MGTDISFGFNDLTGKIFPAQSADQYFSEEIVGYIEGGTGVKRTGELYGHENGDPIRNRKSDVSSFSI